MRVSLGQFFAGPVVKPLLESAAIVLSIVNGLFLARFYMRDRARLRVFAIHPEIYQGWFRLPDSERHGVPTRRFGFLLYLSVSNPGLRPTTLNRWRLKVHTANGGDEDLAALSIPEPSVEFAGAAKHYKVLGAEGLIYDGSTRLEPGDMVSGMAYYEYECDGSGGPRVRGDAVSARVRFRDVSGATAKLRVTCHEKPLHEIEQMIPRIADVGLGEAPNKRFERASRAARRPGKTGAPIGLSSLGLQNGHHHES